MHRYWIFPLILVLPVSLLPIVSLLEGIAPSTIILYLLHFVSIWMPWELLAVVFKPYVTIGAIVGIIIALGAAAWDQIRNGLTDRAGWSAACRLVPNLFWCGFYAFVLIAINDVMFTLLLSTLLNPHPYITFFYIVPFNLAGLLNLTAVLWATIRTINTNDVLTPRVLMSKIRRSARLQES